MFFIEIVPSTGIGGGQPLRLEVSQVLIRHADGTPLCIAGEYGGERSVAIAHAHDPDYNRLLRAFGINEHVICDTLELPQPPRGAKLLAGPE